MSKLDEFAIIEMLLVGWTGAIHRFACPKPSINVLLVSRLMELENKAFEDITMRE